MARNICVDGHVLDQGYFRSGLNRYCANLLRQMERVSRGFDHFRLHTFIPSEAEIERNALVGRQGFELAPHPAMRFRRLWRRGVFALAARGLKADAVFMPCPGPVYFKLTSLAITVHDIIPLLFPEDYRAPRFARARRHLKSSMRWADLIFTDSECSKRDMASTYQLPPERIVVAHLGFDSDLFQPKRCNPSNGREVLQRYGIDRPYVLHTGVLSPRKNLVRLVRAYQLLLNRQKHLSLQLVLCGHEDWGCEDLHRLIHESELQGRVILTGSVPDSDLVVLYQEAACCAMPSLYEGFGLPVLEAMASASPVICSNRSSLPEIAGDAALYFDPESEEEMAAALEKLLDDSALRRQLVDRGMERAKRFSWESCARTTLAALESL